MMNENNGNKKEGNGIHENSQKMNHRFRFWFRIMLLGWLVIILCSVTWNILNEKKTVKRYARVAADAAFNKDVLYRSWNASKGGVYAPISDETPPNPYLKDFPHRDIVTTDSIRLTLVNPAYMTRQVHEMGAKKLGILAHITSLKPIRPANKANNWETAALQKFENGEKEVFEEVKINDRKYLNFMKPLLTEKACLKCHAKQGYKEGDIRGGIRVSIPLSPYIAIKRHHLLVIILIHFFIWLIGLGGILFAAGRIRKTNLMLQQTGIKLSESETRLRQMMQQSPIAIEIYDKNGLQLEVNKAYEQLWSIDAKQTQNKFNLFNSHEVKRTGLSEYISKAYKGMSVSVPEYEFDSGELTGAGKTSGKRWLSTKIYPLFNTDGSVKNIVLMHEDVTGRKKYEEELILHRTKLEELVKQRTVEVETKNKELIEKNLELEHYNNLFVGREFRIKELRDKIKTLEEEITRLREE